MWCFLNPSSRTSFKNQHYTWHMALRVPWLTGAKSGPLGTNTDLQSDYFCPTFTSFAKKSSLGLSCAPNTALKNPNLATHYIVHSILANNENMFHVYIVVLWNYSIIVLTCSE